MTGTNALRNAEAVVTEVEAVTGTSQKSTSASRPDSMPHLVESESDIETDEESGTIIVPHNGDVKSGAKQDTGNSIGRVMPVMPLATNSNSKAETIPNLVDDSDLEISDDEDFDEFEEFKARSGKFKAQERVNLLTSTTKEALGRSIKHVTDTNNDVSLVQW